MVPRGPTCHQAVSLLGLLLSLSLVACQAHLVARYPAVRMEMVHGDYSAAADRLTEDQRASDLRRDRVVFWLDRGTLLHYAHRYDESNAVFIEAEKAIAELFTDSISRGAASILTNPTVTHYEGEDYEKVLLYLYTALNFVQAGDLDNALVEVRRADERLKKLEIFYRSEGSIGTLYTQDAFLQWLNGIFFEEEGSPNDALISFKRAKEIYDRDFGPLFGTPAPPFLVEDLYRAAQRTGFADEAAAYLDGGADGHSLEDLSQNGEVIAIIGLGESPYKQDGFITAPMPDGYILRIAMPELVPVSRAAHSVRLEATGHNATGFLMESVETLAIENYAHRLPRITGLAIARATAKYVAARGLAAAASRGNGGSSILGELVGLVANIANLMTEEADKRSWRTLPAEYHVVRLSLPPGDHPLMLQILGAHGGTLERIPLGTIQVQTGRRTFVSARSLR